MSAEHIGVTMLNVPDDLAEIDRWVLWAYEVRGDKVTKVPRLISDPNCRASSTDPASWGSFDDACRAYDEHAGDGTVNGIGFVVVDADDLMAIDFDHVIDEGGTLEPAIQKFVKASKSYAEITPSGTGIRVWIRGRLPEWSKNRGPLSPDPGGPSVEVYETGRYFTVTGALLPGVGKPGPIREAQALLDTLCREFLTKPDTREQAVEQPVLASSLSDEEVLDRARSSRMTGDEFARRFDHGCSDDDNHSDVDLWMCVQLAYWTQKNPDQMDRLFRRSALMRPKWDDKRSDSTYGRWTIDEAITRTHDVYGAPFDDPTGSTTADWPVLAPSALIGLSGDFVRTVSPYTEADEVGLLVHFLAMAGRAIGPDVYWAVSGDRHPPKVWPLVVGDTSSGRKGTAAGPAKAVFREISKTLPLPPTESNASSGEAIIWSVRDDRKIFKNGETETIPGVEDKRLLLLESEFANVLTVNRREGSVLSSVLRQAWDGDSLNQLAKTKPASCAGGAHVVVIGHITGEELRDTLPTRDRSNGFINRFMLVMVRRSKLLPFAAEMPPEMITELAARMSEVIEWAHARPGPRRRSADANVLWEHWYRWSAGREDLSASIEPLLGRAHPQIMRLALIYSVLDMSEQIQVEHLEAALALWEYSEASMVYALGSTTTSSTPTARIRSTILNAAGPVSKSDLLRQHRGVMDDDLVVILAALERDGEIVRSPSEGGRGRPAEKWVPVNPGGGGSTARPRSLSSVPSHVSGDDAKGAPR